MNEPTQILQGGAVTWTESIAAYPASTWALVYTFINASGKFTVVCEASGADHVASMSAGVTAALVAGTYRWQSKATKVGASELVGYGTVVVVADYAAVDALETRTHAEIMVDSLVAVLENRANEDHLSVSVAGRSVQKMSHAELRAALVDYRAEVAKEKRKADIAAGRRPRGKIRARFPS